MNSNIIFNTLVLKIILLFIHKLKNVIIDLCKVEIVILGIIFVKLES